MTVSVVIATYNSAGYIDACLDALPEAADGVPLQVILVDSCSPDDTVARAAGHPEVEVHALADNVGFARSNNVGIRQASRETLLLLNPDTVARPRSIRILHEFLVGHPACAAVGPRLLDADGHLQPSAGDLPTLIGTAAHAATLNRLVPRDEARRAAWFASLGRVLPRSASRLADHGRARSCEVVWAAAVALRREALERVGLLDEGTFMYGEENDLCARFKKDGWTVWFEPSATVLHYGGGAAPFRPVLAASFYRSRLRYFARNGSVAERLGAPLAVAVGLALRPAVVGLAERDASAAAAAARFSAATGMRLLSAGRAL